MRKAWMKQITAYSFGYAVNSFAIAAVTSIMKGEADDSDGRTDQVSV